MIASLIVLLSASQIRQPVLQAVPIQQVEIDDAFWAPKMKIWRNVTIQDCFDKFEKDGALTNFEKVSTGEGGDHGGAPWFDGLIYEMITGSADFLAQKQDFKLEAKIDAYIDRIAAAAEKDPRGYLNTYTEMKEPGHRWGANGGNDRWQHDLYNGGAMVEAAIHYYRATGKTKLLNVATRMANLMAATMGPAPKANIIPGHAIGEQALTELYRLYKERPSLKSKMSVPVDENSYLHLAEFWIDARGHHEGRTDFGAYDQDEVPVTQQETIEGHAVRAVLLCCGLIDAGEAADRPEYLDTAKRLWDNMVAKRMYITGGIGSIADDEKFGPDYFLPNKGYAETCASVGAAFFHHAMNMEYGDSKYADQLERVLYNGVLAGVSLKGDSYFYQNPLQGDRSRTRWDWNACPCCPPMFLKAMGALPSYIYAQDERGIYTNLYIGSKVHVRLKGIDVSLRQTTNYPWQGRIIVTVDPSRPAKFSLGFREPSWCDTLSVELNGKPAGLLPKVQGYVTIERFWKKGDRVELDLPMNVRRLHADPQVEADRGRVALARGPLVYCLEGADNGDGLNRCFLPNSAKLRLQSGSELGGVTVLEGSAVRWSPPSNSEDLRPMFEASTMSIKAIPYFANANRAPSDMEVWIPEKPSVVASAFSPGLAGAARASASHCFAQDTVDSLNDSVLPKSSDDGSIARFTWWDHRGGSEWVEYDFDHPVTIRSTSVYWWDERRTHHDCRVPKSWRVEYRVGQQWLPVSAGTTCGVQLDQFNQVSFEPVRTAAVRIVAELQPEWSAGILKWRLN